MIRFYLALIFLCLPLAACQAQQAEPTPTVKNIGRAIFIAGSALDLKSTLDVQDPPRIYERYAFYRNENLYFRPYRYAGTSVAIFAGTELLRRKCSWCATTIQISFGVIRTAVAIKNWQVRSNRNAANSTTNNFIRH